MTDPALWIVLIMVIRWIYWSVLWWRGALLRPAAWNDEGYGAATLPPGASAEVAVQPDGALMLRIELVGVTGWPGGMQRDGCQ
jgi:hypothetical protein